jgi:hypothetical protein
MKKKLLFLLLVAGISISADEFLKTNNVIIHLKSGKELTAISVQNKPIKTRVPTLLRFSISAKPEADKFYSSLAAVRGYVGLTIYVLRTGNKVSRDAIADRQEDLIVDGLPQSSISLSLR